MSRPESSHNPLSKAQASTPHFHLDRFQDLSVHDPQRSEVSQDPHLQSKDTPDIATPKDPMTTNIALVSTTIPSGMDAAGDGAGDRLWKGKSRGPVACIFIHAGAGYHSVANEKIHLEVCSEYVASHLSIPWFCLV